MTSKERFLSATKNLPVDQTPIWVMRQAGRYLPEYRALKKKYSFIEIAQTPNLATEVTLQPLRRFPLDAAVIFSDILVIPEAMGQPYHFRDLGGIEMEFLIDNINTIDRLSTDSIPERLDYVNQALKLVRKEIPNQALVGFGGSPWTLACYMVEGGSSKNFTKIKALAYQHPDLFHRLMEKLVISLVEYFKMKINAGVDVIQIFDSWASLCPAKDYESLSLQWIRKIIECLPSGFPVILYARGIGNSIEPLIKTGAQVLGFDHTISLAAFKECYPDIAVQGNLDPIIMNLNLETVKTNTCSLLESMRPYCGHIFNLGHGILPETKIESMEMLINTVREFR